MASRKSSSKKSGQAADDLDRESSRQKGELAALRRMLVASEGTSSLSFAIYNVVRLRDELVQLLSSEFPQICMVRLADEAQDILDVVKSHYHNVNDCRAIFVLDIERPLSAAKGDTSLIRALNSSREQWESFPCPIVFWLADHAAAALSAQAVDLWRYRSHVFEFAAPVDTQAAQTETFPGYENIAGLSFEEKRFRRAELEKRLEEIGDQPSSVLLAHVLDWTYELAKLHEVFNDWKSAERLKQIAVRLTEAEYGADSSETAIALNNLAQLYQATNRLAEAEPLMKRALAIDESSLGENHLNVAGDLNNLAQLYKDTNRLAEAEPLMKRALAIDESSFGENHPNVARDLNNLAGLYKATNRLAEAEPLMKRASEILQASLSNEHPNTQTVQQNYESLLQEIESREELADE